MSNSGDHPLDTPFQLIDDLNRGSCVVFVGDDLDASGPQSKRLASALLDACQAHTTCPVPDCRSERRCASPQGCAVPLQRAAQLYEARFNRGDLVRFVSQQLAQVEPPNAVHRALAQLPVDV